MKAIVKKLFPILCFYLLFPAQIWAGEVNLSIAASLKEVLNDLAESFTKQNPGVKFRENYGGSGALAKQIENGAPADIFISANREWLDYLDNRSLIERTSITTFAYNRLVFVGNSTGQITAMRDLPQLDKIAIGSPKSVPAGEYAMEALKKAGLEGQMRKKLVMAKDVRECLMYVERGEVDGAFVYQTDALLANRSKILFTVPQELHARVTYPLGLTITGAKNREANAFYSYLLSEKGKSVLSKYGFTLK